MAANEGSSRPLDTDELCAWLIGRVAQHIEVPADRISPDRRLTELGLDSLQVLTICGELEDRYGIEVDPVQLFAEPTAESVAKRLSEEFADR